MTSDAFATYRLQLGAELTLDDAAGIVDYLAELGISHVYTSPYMQAAPGSTHGYDVTDPTAVNRELGGDEAHARFVSAVEAAGLRHIVDFVPNHMAIHPSNRWWWDVLKHGPASRYARFFDIDWDPPEATLRRMILVPILGDRYGRVLEAGELVVDLDAPEPLLRYHEHALPLDPTTVGSFRTAGSSDPEAIHELLEKQHYRVAYWKVGDRDLNYRRFFDIKTLAAVRVEDDDVFDAMHERIVEFARGGRVHGLRIDHIDGLRFPRRYLERLVDATGVGFVVVEKILEPEEDLPPEWPVAGTTGYDFLNLCLGVYVDPAGEKPLDETYRSFGGDTNGSDVIHDAKMLVAGEILSSDVDRLVARLADVCERHPRHRDYTRDELREAVRQVLASFPVYRTYVERGRPPSERDRAYVSRAIEDSAARRPAVDAELWQWLEQILLLEVAGDDVADFTHRFQQTSGAVTAKGLEDTAFYRYTRFVALNEVGGDPRRFGTPRDELHRAGAVAASRRPQSMLAGSTHDTKRSEDVRARLVLLSEIPERWDDLVSRWRTHNERHRSGSHPDGPTEYLLYQSIVGAWPIDRDRMWDYMLKAAREAKTHTSWVAADADYERALEHFVDGAFGDDAFLREVDQVVTELLEPWWATALSQTLVRLTFPGVPDVYQGTETWDLSLVDPDNRRPVDFAARRAALADAVTSDAGAVWQRRAEGLPKTLVVHRALDLRRRRPDLFGPGATYRPLEVTGARAENLIAFARGDDAVTLAPRLVFGLGGRWRDTRVELPPGTWRDVVNGSTVEGGSATVADLLQPVPVALLERA